MQSSSQDSDDQIFSLSRRMLPETQFVSPGCTPVHLLPQLLPNSKERKKATTFNVIKQCSLSELWDCFPVIRKHFSPPVRQHLFPCSVCSFSQSLPSVPSHLAITSELHKLVSLPIITHRSVWPSYVGYMLSSRKGTVTKPNHTRTLEIFGERYRSTHEPGTLKQLFSPCLVVS